MYREIPFIPRCEIKSILELDKLDIRNAEDLHRENISALVDADLVLTREEGPQRIELRHHATSRPHVNRAAVAGLPQQDLRRRPFFATHTQTD